MDGGKRISIKRRSGNEKTTSMRNKRMENHSDGRRYPDKM